MDKLPVNTYLPSIISHSINVQHTTSEYFTIMECYDICTIMGVGAQEWRDAAFLRYGLEPPDLPKHCDGCNAKFSICHALD